MNIIAWILFGAAAGFVAHVTDSESVQGGILGAMLLGIVGSITGGFLANLLFGQILFPFDVPAFIIAIVGSLFLLLVHRSVFVRSSQE